MLTDVQEEITVPCGTQSPGTNIGSLAALSMKDLVRESTTENRNFVRGLSRDETYCLELFRRAIVQRDDWAWACIFDLYTPLAKTWIVHYPGASFLPEEREDLVAGAFAKFALALTPTHWTECHAVAGLLDYLKRCIHSVVFNELDTRRRRAREDSLDELLLLDEPIHHDDPATLVVSANSAQELWQAIQGELHSEQERFLFQLCIVEGMKPSEMCTQYRRMFPSVQEIYRLKRNLLERLQRRPHLRRLVDYQERSTNAHSAQHAAEPLRDMHADEERMKWQARHQLLDVLDTTVQHALQGVFASVQHRIAEQFGDAGLHHEQKNLLHPAFAITSADGHKTTYRWLRMVCSTKRCRRCAQGIPHDAVWYADERLAGRTRRTYIGKHLPSGVHCPQTVLARIEWEETQKRVLLSAAEPLRPPALITLSAEDAAALERMIAQPEASPILIERARIVWYANQGQTVAEIVPHLKVLHKSQERQIRFWLQRFRESGIQGLQDRQRPGAPAKYHAETVVQVARTDPPTLGLPFTYWTLDHLENYFNTVLGLAIKRSRIAKLLQRAEVSLAQAKLSALQQTRQPNRTTASKRRTMDL